jgi:LytS/YehU family sensor histidine kinase
LIIKVENNGEPISLSEAELQKKGVGLANIEDRLNNLYGNNFFFKMRNKGDSAGVETIIRIPLK